MNESPTEFPFDNSVQCSSEFDYPTEAIPQELSDLVATRVSQSLHAAMTDLLTKLANYVLPAADPRMTLISLFYASDVDLSYILSCDNTETSIAKRIGVGKQSLNSELKRVRRDFGLIHSVTVKHGVNGETYANNSKKIKGSL